MRALVTGGAGFIGSHLVERMWRDGYEVVVVDDLSTGLSENLAAVQGRERFAFHRLDIAGPEAARLVRDLRPDVLVLLAAQPSVPTSMREPVLDARSNVLGTVNLLAAAVEAGTGRVVFTTSGGTIYGDATPEELPLVEERRHEPNSFYGLSKLLGHEYLKMFAKHFGIEYIGLALGNVYGPRQQPGGVSGVLSIFAQRLLQGQECVVNGEGSATRDFVYVDDVVDALARAVERGRGLVNIGSGTERSVLEVLHVLARHTGSPARFRRVPGPPGEVDRVCLDIGRARTVLGWRPTTPFEEGTAALVRHLEKERGNGQQLQRVGETDPTVDRTNRSK